MAAPPLLFVGAGPEGLRLRTLGPEPGPEPGPELAAEVLRLFCHGIEVGAAIATAAEVQTIPVQRLPRVPLPALIRVAASAEGPDLAEPFRLETAAMAAALLGPTPLALLDLRLEHGMLRGTGMDRRNGLLEPALHARINGIAARPARVEPPVGLPEGGCAFRFAVPVEAVDLTGAGLAITLHAAGEEAALARFAWGPTEPGAAAARLAEMEARLARLEQAGEALRQALESRLEQRHLLQQERIDAFVAGCAALLMDRLAEQPEAALAALIAPPPAPPPASPSLGQSAGETAEVLPADAGFDLGWHAPEEDAAGAFRWMARQGLIRNPAPGRPVAAVRLEVAHLYGAPAPALTAAFDAAPGFVTVTEGAGPPVRFTIRVTPAGGRAEAALLRLDARTAGSPAEDGAGEDARVLSFAVGRAVFEYAG